MRLAIDTNIYAAAVANDAEVVGRLGTAERLYMPLNVVAELRYGFRGGNRVAENERRLTGFLASDRVEVVYPDDRTTHVYAELANWLKTRGTAIPHNDIWIAALTVQHGLTLYSRDKHFDCLPQVPQV